MFLLVSSFTAYSQEIMNDPGVETKEVIQQISAPGINDIMGFQTLNQGIGNFASIHQAGNQNTAAVNQKVDAGSGFSNQSHGIQEGNLNEMTIGQIGSGNLMLGFQIGYQSNALSFYPSNLFSFGLGNNGLISETSNESNVLLTFGERNKLKVIQEGNDNGIIALQQGTDHSISVGQKGSNSYLAILQRGVHNTVNGYVQENVDRSILFESISQVGENLSLTASDVSRSKPIGNVFNQSGVNLSLEVNNGLINSVGGIEINQTGRDMKVMVEQSFFTSPMQ